VVFENGSQLSRIGDRAFASFSSLSSMFLPRHVFELGVDLFIHTNITAISVADGNLSFKADGDFLLNFAGTEAIFYFGRGADVIVPRDVERLKYGCCRDNEAISRVVFESGSILSCIEDWAFHGA
jgi:hypothetical protein